MSFLTGLVLVALALLPGTSLAPAITAHLADLPGGAAAPLTTNYAAVAVPARTSATAAAPALSAASWYGLDVATGMTLAGSRADTPLPIASITKLATALVIVRSHPTSQMVTLPALPAYQADDEIIGLQTGERLSIHDLLAALLINSADDAADALALADSGTETAFVAKMNQTMATWGISEAHFSNPSGLVDTGNTVSARAVAQIAQLALQNPTIKQLVATPSLAVSDAAGRQFTLTTTDQLLQNGQFQGIKTGYTAAAGQCFVGLTQVQGHQIITVVLGSQDRFGDTVALTNWINQTYQWQAP